MIISNRCDEVPQQPWLDTFLTQAAPRQVRDMCVCVCACTQNTHLHMPTHTHLYIHRKEKKKKKGENIR